MLNYQRVPARDKESKNQARTCGVDRFEFAIAVARKVIRTWLLCIFKEYDWIGGGGLTPTVSHSRHLATPSVLLQLAELSSTNTWSRIKQCPTKISAQEKMNKVSEKTSGDLGSKSSLRQFHNRSRKELQRRSVLVFQWVVTWCQCKGP